MSSEFQAVLDFWFGPYSDDIETASKQAKLWWGKNEETDKLIKTEFEKDVQILVGGGHCQWLETPHGWLAAIIVLDQFSRNIYRDTPRAFTQDALALKLCVDGLASGVYRLLRPVERVFFYLPLEHSESVELQALCVELFIRLREEAPDEQHELFSGYVDFAGRHKVIVDQFGRFPHRNKICGRESTPEEIEFLKQPGSGF